MKTCNKCQVNKEFSQFYKDKNNLTDGHYSICKECKESGTRKWRSENKSVVANTAREYRNRPENALKMRLVRYNLEPEQYILMLKIQEGKCKLCFKTPETDKRPLCVDHNHVTGKVRGLLCYGCNRLMVLIDNAELLKRALAYAN